MPLRTRLPYLPLAVALLGACTTLGPMPATTGLSAVPAQRTSVELGVAAVPGYYLSESTTASSDGAALPQTSVAFEPGARLRLPGLVVGGRTVDDDGDTQLEPIVGYRGALTRTVSLAGFVSGTHAWGGELDAEYSLTRLGGELTLDARMSRDGAWLGIHLVGTLSATLLDAHGSYCVDDSGRGTDCDAGLPRTTAAFAGLFTSAVGGVAFDIARRPHRAFHGLRLSLLYAYGAMPDLIGGVPVGVKHYGAGGVSLSVAFGARD